MLALNLMREQKLCKRCGKIKPTSEFCAYQAKGGSSRDGLRYECKACGIVKLAAWGKSNAGKIWLYQRNYRRGLRQKVLEKYGARCADPNCLVLGGCTDVRALQLDHVNNDGARERSVFSKPSTKAHWQKRTNNESIWKKAFTDESGRYQLLCANCNVIKEHDRLKKLVAERNIHRLGAIRAAS